MAMTKKGRKADTLDRGRFSATRKTDAVLCLLRGEDLETLSRVGSIDEKTEILKRASAG